MKELCSLPPWDYYRWDVLDALAASECDGAWDVGVCRDCYMRGVSAEKAARRMMEEGYEG